MDHAGIFQSLERFAKMITDLADQHTPLLADKLGRLHTLASRQAFQTAELERLRDKLQGLVAALPRGSSARAHRLNQLDRVQARIESLAPKVELLSARVRQLFDLGRRFLELIEAENRALDNVLADFRDWINSREEPLRRQVELARQMLDHQGDATGQAAEESPSDVDEAGIDHIVEQVLGENVGDELELLLANVEDGATVRS
ncbi:MAG: hypothetical protein KJ621_04175 [Proteobacteria bacterium]|nr:hypothetical protein [Pseudomonadota bacterium]MBU1742324.1 hypothetical protein [Pseudomonadota bacterium]